MAGKTKIKPKEEINEFSNNFTWSHVTKKITELKPYEFNPRNITDKGLADLEKSIGKFGLAEPIVINTNGTIIGGHARYFALKKHGVKEVNCYEPDHELSEIEMKELNVRLNKNIAGDWDFDILANNFEIDDLLTWGWDENELDINLWKPEVDEEKLDDVPELQKEAVSQLGDIFLIDGKHRVMCGDSTNKEDVEKLMDAKKADMVFTDPPYGVSYADKNKYLNTIARGNRIQTPIQNDHLSVEETGDKVIYPAFCQIKNILNDYSSYYITAPQGGELLMMMRMMMKAGIPLRHMIIWSKNNHVLGRSDYNYKHEPILYGWVEHHKFYGNGEQRFSVWNYDKPHKSDLHPTMKPIKLICNAILNSTQNSNNIIADLFLGSGSTLIASEQTNRICYGMELDPIYIDVILRRYKNLYSGCKIECLNRGFDFKMLDKNE